jgi:Ca2+/H+ antiporter, TMEM165/GDT1 family
VSVLFDFLLVFAVIGGLELADRTNFALIGFAARHPPLPTWAGAAVAFVATTALSVAIGTILIQVLEPEIVYLRLGGGIALLLYALYLARAPEGHRTTPATHSAFLSAFLMIFVLELGDTTMIFLVNFVFSIPDPLIIFLAGALALCLVAASGALIGSHLGARVEPKLLDRVVVVILVIVGLLTITYALEPGWFPAFT